MNINSVTLVHQSEQRNIEIAASLTVKLGDLKRSPLKDSWKVAVTCIAIAYFHIMG